MMTPMMRRPFIDYREWGSGIGDRECALVLWSIRALSGSRNGPGGQPHSRFPIPELVSGDLHPRRRHAAEQDVAVIGVDVLAGVVGIGHDADGGDPARLLAEHAAVVLVDVARHFLP